MRSLMTVIAAAASLLAAAGAARADVEIGVLECRSAGGVGFIFGSTKDLDCWFKPSNGAPVVPYVGTIRRYGIDIGVTGNAVLLWGVYAATPAVGPDSLAGAYGGVTAGATIGVGGSANALIGGFDRQVTLQPLSIEAQTGLNVAAGVASLDLLPGRR